MTPDDALAQALGLLRRARLAMKRTGGGRVERAYLLEQARKMVDEARQALAKSAVAGDAERKIFEDVEASLLTAEKDLAREA
jgi:hypothetical protein